MPLPSNGITAEVIREVMPPYRLDPDLMAATVAALPPPPPDTTTAWRQTRLTRLLGEIAALKPADAAQGRIASSLLIVREMADSFAARVHAPGLELNEMCRVSRTTTELLRSAAALERTLARHQQKPVPFYGTVVQDEVDIPALAALWGGGIPASADAGPLAAAGADSLASAGPGAKQPPATPDLTTKPRPGAAPAAAPAAAPPPTPAARPARRNVVPPAPPAAAPEPPPPTPPLSPDRPPTEAPAQRRHPGAPSPKLVRQAGTSPDWVIEQLDQGPGWAREVLRPRTAADPAPRPGEGSGARPGEGRDHGAAPRSAAR